MNTVYACELEQGSTIDASAGFQWMREHGFALPHHGADTAERQARTVTGIERFGCGQTGLVLIRVTMGNEWFTVPEDVDIPVLWEGVTVGELIEQLQRHPAELPVFLLDENGTHHPLNDLSPFDSDAPASAENPLSMTLADTDH